MKKAKKLSEPTGKEIVVYGPNVEYNSHVGNWNNNMGAHSRYHNQTVDSLQPGLEKAQAPGKGRKALDGRNIDKGE